MITNKNYMNRDITKFYGKNLSEIIDEYYNGDITKYALEVTKEYDERLKKIKAKHKEFFTKSSRECEKNKNELHDVSYEEYDSFNYESPLSIELEQRINKEIEIIKEIQRINNNRTYTEEEAFSLIFGEDYINGTLPH